MGPAPFFPSLRPEPVFRHRKRGLSLLEVILAIAILAGCIAVIGELVRLGSRQAEEARELTTAQLLCESKIAEIAAGVIPAEAVSSVPFENDPRWLYSVTVNSLDQEGLLDVRVTIEQSEPSRVQPLTFTLVCWMIDPSLALMEEPAEMTVDDEATTSGQAASSGATSSDAGSADAGSEQSGTGGR
jgi:prepilin-type N-terminal cleavage/methylation domain-containing protein